jgi:hypothetical protein
VEPARQIAAVVIAHARIDATPAYQNGPPSYIGGLTGIPQLPGNLNFCALQALPFAPNGSILAFAANNQSYTVNRHARPPY